MQTVIRFLAVLALATVIVGCGADKPPYEPGKGKVPEPPPQGAQTTPSMPNPGSEK